MQRTRPALLVAALCCGLLLVSACQNNSSNDSKKSPLARMGLSIEAANSELIAIAANPSTVVIDTTNAATPKDANGKFIGTSTVTATVHDTQGALRVGVGVVFTTDSGTMTSGGAPVLTDAQGVATDTLTVTQDAPKTVNVHATVEEESSSVPVTVNVILPNQPPVADAGADRTIECSSPNGTPVALDGTHSSDPDSTPGTNDNITKYEWLVNGAVVASTATATVTLPLGTTTVTLRVTDKAGATATDDVVITVADTTPPALHLVAHPNKLWPPNHTMRDVDVQVEMVDACTPPGQITVVLTGVTSSEPDNGTGDGDTDNDIQGADVGTDDRSVQLRAERSGHGNGRTYTLNYTATDATGLASEGSVKVRVPHDQGH
jgi:K319-like protein